MIEILTSSSAVRITTLFAIFVLISLVAFAGISYALRRRTAKEALQAVAGVPITETGNSPTLRAQQNQSIWAKLAKRIEDAGLDLGDTKDDRLRETMRKAGYDSPMAPRIYTMTRLGLVFLLPGMFLLIALTRPEPPSFVSIYVIGSILGFVGLFLPSLFVRAKADRREEEIVNGFPDCLDLMLVCIEAGLGIEAAMDRVGREMVQSHPLVAEILSLATLQLRAGATREEAFRKMADAASVDEIRSFSTLLIQSDRLGTSLGNTLRVYAEEMREKRRMRAEEKAHRLPVLISVPLVVFMLPTMIGVMMLPASIRMMKDIFPMMVGG